MTRSFRQEQGFPSRGAAGAPAAGAPAASGAILGRLRRGTFALVIAVASTSLAYGSTEESLEAVAECLRQLRDGAPHGVVVQELRQLGPDQAPLLLGILAGTEPLPPDTSGPLLSPATEPLFLEAMADWPTEAIFESVAQLESVSGTRGTLLLLRVLGALGDRNALRLFFDVLDRVPQQIQQHPSIAPKIEQSLAGILRRDPHAHLTVSSRLRELGVPTLMRIAQAVAQASAPQGPALLESLTGRNTQLDLVVLESLGSWSPARLDCEDFAAAEIALRFLDSAQELTRARAASTLGKLRHSPAIPLLIELLDDRDPRVARAAHWAITQTVAGPRSDDAETWRAWLASEQEWFTDSGELLRIASHEEAGAAVRALRELSEHPLYKFELVEGLARAIHNPSAPVAVAACGTLAALNAPCGVRPLVDALEDPRADVRNAAERALAGMTGEVLPKAPQAWRQWLSD